MNLAAIALGDHSIPLHFGNSIIKHGLAESSQSWPMAYPSLMFKPLQKVRHLIMHLCWIHFQLNKSLSSLKSPLLPYLVYYESCWECNIVTSGLNFCRDTKVEKVHFSSLEKQFTRIYLKMRTYFHSLLVGRSNDTNLQSKQIKSEKSCVSFLFLVFG